MPLAQISDTGTRFILIAGLLGLAAVGGGFAAWLAAQKHRDPIGWFFLGLLFGPLALLAVGLAPRLYERPNVVDYVGDPRSLEYGRRGEDDMAIHPEAVALAEGTGGYVLLDESAVAHPLQASASWPIIPGNRVMWLTNQNNGSIPVALVSSALSSDREILIGVRSLIAATQETARDPLPVTPRSRVAAESESPPSVDAAALEKAALSFKQTGDSDISAKPWNPLQGPPDPSDK